jgi:putative ABC transport system permease protein
MGVGIGGCTLIFAVADVLLFRPLPYAEPDRLVWIYTDSPPNRFNFSVADFQALDAAHSSFEAVAALQTSSQTYVGGERAEVVQVWAVTPGFFELLGVSPVAGRTATRDEGEPGSARTVVVSSDFASTRLGAPPDAPHQVIGRSIGLDDQPFEVIGVLPAGFGPLGARTDVFTTQQFEPPTRRGPFFQVVLGRLAAEVEPEAAAAELREVNRRLFPIWRDSYQDEAATWALAPLEELAHGDSSRTVVLAIGSVVLLLLLAMANSANLLLTRVRSRQRELAVRVALGASREQVLGHLLAESCLLTVCGTAVALALAGGAIDLLPVVAGSYLPRLGEVELGGRTLALALTMGVGSGALFAVVSSLHTGTASPAVGLHATANRSMTSSPRAQRSQRVLVAAQVAVAVPLLAGTALLATSLRNLGRADPGFDPEGLLSARVSLAAGRYADDAERRLFWWELEERVAAIPGVQAAGVSDSRPPVEAYNYNNYDLEDAPTPEGDSQPVAAWVSADAGFLETLGVRVLEGRSLERADEIEGAPPVVVVDEQWARRHFPGSSALGKRLREGGATSGPWTTVVGVVSAVTYAGVGGDTGGTVYAPWTSFSQPFVVARVNGDLAPVLERIRRELQRLDPTAPLTEVSTGVELLRASYTQPRHLAWMLSAFSSIALLLAALGLYGVTAHTVQSSRRDIAVRLALGGSVRRVLELIVGRSLALVALGLMVGVVAAPAFTRLLAGLLFDVEPADVGTLASSTAVLAAVAMVACAVPGWRAVNIDPATVLKED